MSNWVVDIGNTKSAFGLVSNDGFGIRLDIPTHDLADADLGFLAQGDTVLLASVVPSATAILLERLQEIECTGRVIRSEDVPIESRYLEPQNLGTDRILAAFAAHTLYAKPLGKPAIVVSLGTATTFECISKDGVYLGGAITLGIGSIIDAIHDRTAQLPKVPLEIPSSAIGRTTIESLQSGIVHTQLLGIAQFIWVLAEEAFTDDIPIVIATGGLASFAQAHTQIFDHVDPDLVLKGISLTL